MTKNPSRGGSYVRRKDGTLHRLTPEEEARGHARRRKSFSEAVEETLATDQLSATAVLDRIKESLGIASDVQLAELFGVSPQSISNRRTRNFVPYREAIYLAMWAGVSIDYLLTGVRTLQRP
jgi:hypothetical protein